MIQVKNSCNIQGLRPEALFGIMVAYSIHRDHGFDFVLTSATDGAHSRGSLHYVGLAFDFRTRHIPVHEREAVVRLTGEALGPQWDVIYEGTHCHCEFQPKETPFQ